LVDDVLDQLFNEQLVFDNKMILYKYEVIFNQLDKASLEQLEKLCAECAPKKPNIDHKTDDIDQLIHQAKEVRPIQGSLGGNLQQDVCTERIDDGNFGEERTSSGEGEL
jgi:hypothetical protein